jgi:hypothetical protein
MAIYLIPRPALEFSILAVGMALCRIHGPYYARCFLEDHGVDKDVITELLDSDDGPTTAPQPQLPTEP